MRISHDFPPFGPPSHALSCRGTFSGTAQGALPVLSSRPSTLDPKAGENHQGQIPGQIQSWWSAIDFIVKSEWIYMILYVHFTMFHHINNKDLTLNIHQ